MKKSLISAAALAVVLGAGFMSSAVAGPVTYQLNVLDETGKTGPSEGTVTLTQGINEVLFMVSPNADYAFANTGGHYVFAFNLASAFSTAKVLLTGDTLIDFTASMGTLKEPPFGDFTNALDFSTSSKVGNGLSGKYNTPLTFTVQYTGLSIDNFIRNEIKDKPGYRFAADLGNTVTGNTGSVASSELGGGGGGSTGNAPEPASLALLGVGMLAIGALRRKA